MLLTHSIPTGKVCDMVAGTETTAQDTFAHLVKRHPCFNADAHAKHGRIHLPVSPTCNIGCRFCRREFNTTDIRPGVSQVLLTPEEAVGVVGRALELCPAITVVGIAGPGESLATPHYVALRIMWRQAALRTA